MSTAPIPGYIASPSRQSGDQRDDWNSANAAPCGSARTEKRPAPSISEGGTHTLAPSDFALSVEASQFELRKYASQCGGAPGGRNLEGVAPPINSSPFLMCRYPFGSPSLPGTNCQPNRPV